MHVYGGQGLTLSVFFDQHLHYFFNLSSFFSCDWLHLFGHTCMSMGVGGYWFDKRQCTSVHLNEDTTTYLPVMINCFQPLWEAQDSMRISPSLTKMLTGTGPVLCSFYADIYCFCVVMSSTARSCTEGIVRNHLSLSSGFWQSFCFHVCNVPWPLEWVIQMPYLGLRNHQSRFTCHLCHFSDQDWQHH